MQFHIKPLHLPLRLNLKYWLFNIQPGFLFILNMHPMCPLQSLKWMLQQICLWVVVLSIYGPRHALQGITF